jgi:hypothetical protein
MTRFTTAFINLLIGSVLALTGFGLGLAIIPAHVSCTVAGKTYAAGTTFAITANGNASTPYTPYVGTGSAYVCSPEGHLQHL